jgi:membrane protein
VSRRSPPGGHHALCVTTVLTPHRMIVGVALHECASRWPPLDATRHETDQSGAGVTAIRARIAALRRWLERLLLWRVWERMLEVEFVDRSVALAGKAFVSFFPLVIVVAAFVPDRLRSSIINTLTSRIGLRGEALVSAQAAFASSDDVRKATGVLGLVLTFFFATAFTTALQRVYLHAWRRRPRSGAGTYWRGVSWLLAVVVYMALLGALSGSLGDGAGRVTFAVVAVTVSAGLWWFTAWFLLLGDVRPRVLIPTGLVTGIAMTAFAASATIWMPTVASDNESQFGVFGIALSLVTWFSGAAFCVFVGACAGAELAEDSGRVGVLVRGPDATTLRAGATPPLPAPTHALTLRDAFQSQKEEPHVSHH